MYIYTINDFRIMAIFICPSLDGHMVLWYGAVRPFVRPSVRLLARKNIDANGGFFSNFVHKCA